MALPGPGTELSLQDIGLEFADTAPYVISDYYRGGSFVGNYTANNGIPTAGEISIGNFYGANSRNIINVTISANTTNYDAYASRTPNYFAGKSDMTYTINPGVTISSTATSTPAFSVPSQFSPGDTVRIINNGYIQGRGGDGGPGGNSTPTQIQAGNGGGTGGAALRAQRPVTVQNAGTIYGGGGGGGGGGAARDNSQYQPPGGYFGGAFFPAGSCGGGGGGGGRGTSTGGTGGTASFPGNQAPGGGGQNGSIPANGNGGGGGVTPGGFTTARAGNGGHGGGAGAAGTAGQISPVSPAGQGQPGPAGGAGNYIQGNPFVTWQANGTRAGGVG